jgi:hypothetical protein
MSERRSEKVQDRLDREFLAGTLDRARYELACRYLESLTDYEEE